MMVPIEGKKWNDVRSMLSQGYLEAHDLVLKFVCVMADISTQIPADWPL